MMLQFTTIFSWSLLRERERNVGTWLTDKPYRRKQRILLSGPQDDCLGSGSGTLGEDTFPGFDSFVESKM